jgi:hypothetical protein
VDAPLGAQEGDTEDVSEKQCLKEREAMPKMS